jgi:hypothetical protein
MLDFEGTKKELAEHAVVPEFAEIKTGGQRRRTRRRIGGVVAVVAIVALGVTTLPLLTDHRTEVRPAVELGRTVAGPIAGAAVPIEGLDPRLYQAVDSRQVYTVAKTPSGGAALARTLDGGRTWKAWQLPSGASAKSLILLGRTTLEIGAYLSRDAGQTWAKIPGTASNGLANSGSTITPVTVVLASTTVNSVPAGWFARAFCVAQFDCKLYATDPVHGGWHPLAHQPAATDVTQDARGRLWAAKRALVPGQGDKPSCSLSTSTDRGASWSAYPIPPRDGCAGTPSIGRDGTAYALVAIAGATDKTPGMLVSTDSGKSWQRRANGMDLTDVVVLPDGGFVGHPVTGHLDPQNSLVLSENGGRSFAKIPGTERVSTIERTSIGAYSTGITPEGLPMVSDDGRHWGPIPVLPAK